MSTETFVEQLYSKFLFRTSDATGKADWVNRIETGQESLAQVTYNFAQSPEYSLRAKSVSELYFLLFERVPDSAGMQHWLDKVDQGLNTDDLVNLFMSSQEYANKYGAITDDSTFIEQLFERGTGEPLSSYDKNSFDDSLQSGGRAKVISDIADHGKFNQKHGNEIEKTSLYYGVLGRAPSAQELAGAPDDNLELINSLYIDQEYAGESLPDTNFIGFQSASSTLVENDGSLTIKLSRSGPFDETATVSYTVTASDSTQNGDFTVSTGSVTFAAGSSTAEVQLQTVGNTKSQPDRSYSIKLESADGGKIGAGNATHTVTVTDDDRMEPTYIAELAEKKGVTITTQAEGTWLGTSTHGMGDVNGDGLNDFLIKGYDTSYLVFGNENLASTLPNLSQLDGSNGFKIEGKYTQVSSAGDINNDGRSEIIISFNHDGTNHDIVLFGHSDGWQPTLTSTSLASDVGNSANLEGSLLSFSGISTGLTISAAGDVNGDGIDDLIASSAYASNEIGQVQIVYGKTGSWSPTIDLSTINASQGALFTGQEETSMRFGSEAKAIGDINGDGVSDLLIQEGDYSTPTGKAIYLGPSGFLYPGVDETRKGTEKSYLIYGKKGGWDSTVSMDNLAETSASVLTTIQQIEAGGDFNGDGIDDLLVSSANPTVIFGNINGLPTDLSLTSPQESNGITLSYSENTSQLGKNFSSVGDVNSDGFDDLLISANASAAPGMLSIDQAYILYGHSNTSSSPIDLYAINKEQGTLLRPIPTTDNGYRFGSSTNIGDVNGDKTDDFLIGVPKVTVEGLAHSGQTYLLFGSDQLFV